MNSKYLFLFLATAFLATPIQAQHSDIQFSYEDDMIVIRDGIPGNTDGLQIFEGNFPTSGFSVRFTENPGFLAEVQNGDMLIAGDEIGLEILPSPTFGSHLTYFDPLISDFAATEATITIEDNSGSTGDLIVGNTELMGDNPLFIQTADSAGEIHSHIDFLLSEEADFGAFGILLNMQSNNPAIDDSQPVWIVFNYGMSPFEFDELAIPAFVGDSVLIGDVNGDGDINLLDVAPFVDLLSNTGFLPAADINGDGAVNLLDVDPFVQLLTN